MARLGIGKALPSTNISQAKHQGKNNSYPENGHPEKLLSKKSETNATTASNITTTIVNLKNAKNVDYMQQAQVLQQQMIAANEKLDRLRAQQKILEQLLSRIKNLMELKKARELEGTCTKLLGEQIDVLKKQYNEQISS